MTTSELGDWSAIERLLGVLFETAPVILFAADRQGIVTHSLGRGLRALGRWRTEIVGHPAFEHYRDLPWIPDAIRRVLAGETIRVSAEVAGVCYDNYCAPIRSANGAVVGFIGIALDVTKERANLPSAECGEPKAREKVVGDQDLIEASIDPTVVMDEDGNIREFNAAAERAFGYARSDVIGKELAALIVPASLRDQHRRGLARFRTTNETRVIGKLQYFSAMRANGTEFPAEVAIARVSENGLRSFVGQIRDITERIRAEQAVRENEARLRLIATATNDIVFDWDFSTNKIWWNQNPDYAKAFQAPEEPDIEWWRARVHPDDAARVLASRLAAFRCREPNWRTEYRFRRPDGVYADMVVRGHVTYRDDGAATRMVGAIADITDRKRAERDLESSLSFLRAALESTADGILVVGTHGKITLHNAKFVEMWRVPDGMIATGDDESALAFVLDQLEDPAAFLARVHELYGAPEAESSDVLLLKDGRVFERYSRPQLLGEAIVGRVWCFRDVTDRALAEARLRKTTALKHALLDNMLDSVFACDANGQVFLMNKAAQDLAGSQTEGGLSVRELTDILALRSEDGQRLDPEESPLARAMRGEVVHTQDRISESHGGRTRVLRTSASPIRDEAGKAVGAVAVSRDVTQSVELEHLKDQFVRVAAHELKTPVAVMKSYAQLALRESLALSPPLLKKLRAIERGADRIDDIVRKLLDISQLLLGPLRLAKERLDLGELVEEVLNRVGTSERHPLHERIGKSVMVHGDRERLAQVAAALLDNAIRYSPAGGDIEVSLTADEREATIAVEDHGIGIPGEKQGQICERFYRAHSGTAYDYGGMGVGLYISREIVRQHGGTMRFQSEAGVGSRFSFSLPLPGTPLEDTTAEQERVAR